TFADTVACRRATTYPDAFSTAAALPPLELATAVTACTSIARSRNSAYAAAAAARRRANAISHLYSDVGSRLGGSGLRSMRRLSRALWSKDMSFVDDSRSCG